MPNTPLYIEPGKLREVCHSYSARKATGADHWQLRPLSEYPDGAFTALAHFYHLVAHHGVWPDSFCVNIMALLGKSSGGLRTIAKTPMLYRAWCQATKSVAADWE